MWQEKYQQLARINAQTRQVENIKQPTEGPKALVLTHETRAEAPADRQRTTIGVGEGIDVMANEAVEWELQGVARWVAEQKSPKKLIFFAGDQPGTIRVIARIECEEKAITFTVIAPTHVIFVKRTLLHVHKILNAGFIADVYLQPKNVNFSNLEVCEVQSYSYGGTGLWADYNGKPHGKEEEYKNGQSEWGRSIGYQIGLGTEIGLGDTVRGYRDTYCPNDIPHSEIHYDIPYKWRLKNNTVEHFLPSVHQAIIIESNGNVTIQKGNASVTFHYLAPTINKKLYEKLPVPKEICPKLK